MKSIFTRLSLSLMLVFSLAPPAALATTKQGKTESPHAAAVKKCNTDYNDAVKKATDDYNTSVKDAKMKKGKERSEAMTDRKSVVSSDLLMLRPRKSATQIITTP